MLFEKKILSRCNKEKDEAFYFNKRHLRIFFMSFEKQTAMWKSNKRTGKKV